MTLIARKDYVPELAIITNTEWAIQTLRKIDASAWTADPEWRMSRRTPRMVSVRLRSNEIESARRTIDQLQQALAKVQRSARRPEDDARARAHTVLEAVANLPFAVLIANNNGRFIMTNDAAVTLTGYTRAELLRMSVWDLTPSPNLSAGLTLWRQFLVEQPRMTGIYELRRKDGSHVRAKYIAVANVVPGLHLSALTHSGRQATTRSVRQNVRSKRSA